MINHQKIKIEAEKAKHLLSQYAAVFDGDEEDANLIIDSETDLMDLIKILIEQEDDLQSFIDGADTRIKDLIRRKDRLCKQQKTVRELILQALKISELNKIDVGFATVSVKKTPPRLEIYEESLVPASFFEKKTTVELNKKELKEVLKTKVLPGCGLVQHETIQIRRL